jgi:uncharacterized membrane protein
MFVYWSGDITEVVDGKHTLVKRINDTQKDIIIYILGVLSAAVTQILGYYFGSSQGSATKSRSLDKVLAQTTSGAEK